MPETEIPKIYAPQDWENKLYAQWEESGFFNPDSCIKTGLTDATKPAFSLVLPPPNVTGTLHAGHAAMLAIEDAIIRYHRMRGDRTLWLPGTDHAAIATQSKVEKIIFQEEQKTRSDLGREEFLKRVEAFAKESHDTIVNQCKKMGSSLDWSREAYTLDAKRNLAVRTAFKRMYDDGLIYRGYRIVNWDPKGQTTISDDEIVYREEPTTLFYFQYGPFVISTARPETKFGDKYVVMHPDDERYTKWQHGQKFEAEWINGSITATVIKDTSIDMAFGTGVMTITPWHSVVDFEIALRHDLDKEQIIDEQGRLLPIAAEFAGMDIAKARPLIVEKLHAKNLIIKEEKYTHNIATAERTGGIVEPQIKRQWFVAVNKKFDRDGRSMTLKQLMQESVTSGRVGILPTRFSKTYFHWIDNLRDWCISRQIWFGHRIPVWYCLSCGKEKISDQVKSRWFFVRHGETDWNKQEINAGITDIPLNETGREQARLAADKLLRENIDVIFSSRLSRAHETAQIIGDKIGISEIILDDRLQERNMGDAEGLSYTAVKKQFPDVQTYHGKPANNESYAEAEERIWTAVSEHLEKHSHKNVLIASHGAVLRALLRKIKNIDPESIMQIEKISNATPFSLDVLDPCEQCGHHFFEQDPDTLDTWFSSGLWTFSTLGWPDTEKTAKAGLPGPENDFTNYHPTTLLETGYDILFFWVARMILMSEYLLNTHPFNTVYLHGLVRDEQGRKMSKSLGNVIDPLTVSEQYGADALRLALISGATPGNDVKLSDEKIVAMRNFTNKLWNLARYVGTVTKFSEATLEAKSDADRFILAKLETITASVTRHLDEQHYELSLATEELRDFTWGDFADWYVEVHKIEKNDALIRFTFDTILRLWHPFMPFVTEAIHQTFHFNKSQFLMVTPWPVFESTHKTLADQNRFELIKELIVAIRNTRANYHIEPAKKMSLSAFGASERMIRDNEAIFKRLARIETIHTITKAITPKNTIPVQAGPLQVFLHLDGIVDVAKEKQRLETELAEKTRYTISLQSRLDDPKFSSRAPEHILTQTKTLLDETTTTANRLRESLAKFDKKH